MARYKRLREMINGSGWKIEDDGTLEDLSYHFFLESVCSDLVTKYDIDEIVSAMCDEDGEDNGDTDQENEE